MGLCSDSNFCVKAWTLYSSTNSIPLWPIRITLWSVSIFTATHSTAAMPSRSKLQALNTTPKARDKTLTLLSGSQVTVWQKHRSPVQLHHTPRDFARSGFSNVLPRSATRQRRPMMPGVLSCEGAMVFSKCVRGACCYRCVTDGDAVQKAGETSHGFLLIV